jgi:hypothetical protein
VRRFLRSLRPFTPTPRSLLKSFSSTTLDSIDLVYSSLKISARHSRTLPYLASPSAWLDHRPQGTIICSVFYFTFTFTFLVFGMLTWNNTVPYLL